MKKLFSLIYSGDLRLADEEDKVLAPEAYSEIMDAASVLKKAKDDAKKFKEKTKEEAELMKSEAKEAGFQEGLTRVYEQLLKMEEELRRIRHEAMKAILPLALTAAKKIVGKELESNPDTIVSIVSQAIAPVTQNKRIRIYVSKEERELLEKKKSKLKDLLEQVESLQILERSDITPGGCIIETESGIINATLENQWHALEKAFERYLKKPK